jgi:hypothetical protein
LSVPQLAPGIAGGRGNRNADRLRGGRGSRRGRRGEAMNRMRHARQRMRRPDAARLPRCGELVLVKQPPSRSRRRTRSGSPAGGGGGFARGGRCSRKRCGLYLCSARCTRAGLAQGAFGRRSTAAEASRRTLPLHRSARAFAVGAASGVRITRTASDRKTSSKPLVNLLSPAAAARASRR